jgi:hypothetical protein
MDALRRTLRKTGEPHRPLRTDVASEAFEDIARRYREKHHREKLERMTFYAQSAQSQRRRGQDAKLHARGKGIHQATHVTLKEISMKVLNPTIHAMLDYGLASLFLLAPTLFGFSGTAATLAYATGLVYIAASLLTKYPLGAIKLIPFPVHGVLESIMAAAWIVSPWLFGFAEVPAARNFFIIAGVALLGVAAVTDYRAASTERADYSGNERRQLGTRRRHAMAVRQDRRTHLSDRRRAGGGYSAA